MQIECRQFVVGKEHSYAPLVALELNTSVYVHMTIGKLLNIYSFMFCIHYVWVIKTLLTLFNALFAGNQHVPSTNH